MQEELCHQDSLRADLLRHSTAFKSPLEDFLPFWLWVACANLAFLKAIYIFLSAQTLIPSSNENAPVLGFGGGGESSSALKGGSCSLGLPVAFRHLLSLHGKNILEICVRSPAWKAEKACELSGLL